MIRIRALLRALALVAVGIIIPAAMVTPVTAAGTASFSLAPASGSYTQGINFTVNITESSTDPVNAVQADLAYDQSKLQYVSTDLSGSAFSLNYSSTGGSGAVSIASTTSGGTTVTGTKNVGAVTFKVLGGSGSTSVSFGTSSAIVRTSDSQNVWNGSTTGGNYTLSTPAAPGGSTATTGGGGGTTSTSSGSTSTTPKTSTTSTGSSSTSAPSTALTISPAQQKANPAVPVPVNGGQLNPSGFLVAITVLDTHGKPQSGVEVTIGTKAVKTDKSGVASFAGISSGVHEVTLKSSGGQVKGTVIVNGNVSPSTPQKYTLTVKPKNLTPVYIGLGGLVVFLVVFFAALKIIKNRINKMGKTGPSPGLISEPIIPIQPTVTPPTNDAPSEEPEPSSTLETLNKIQVDMPKPETVIHPSSGGEVSK